WIQECRSSHRTCQYRGTSRRQTPARLLQVAPTSTGICLRLVSLHGIDLAPGYVCLTHCWGTVPMPFKTTHNNLDRYMEYIDYNVLPLTFREAIELTAGLHIFYIWIDTLCVIQDDALDWSRESAKMADIYRGAVLTLSATNESSAYEGCGLFATTAPAKQLSIFSDRSKTQIVIIAPRANQLPTKTARLKWQDAPIEKRAWTLQKRILSRRILHMDRGQFHWQCAAYTEMEDGIELTAYAMVNDFAWRPLESHRMLDENDGSHKRHLLRIRWWEWVRNYSQRHLTFPSDNYAAFAGITRLYQEISLDESLVGL
ncbi:HET-domain-containing protein, partial [Setomelanomma holmii]